MSAARLLLLPFSFLYGLVLQIRHWLYDTGIITSYDNFPVPVVCVGNLNLGGTGKTPFTEFLIQNLAGRYRIGILSRGYGRQTKGYVLADQTATAGTIGDEPMQIYKKYGDTIVLAVCENRKTGIHNLAGAFPELQLVILDDALQHRAVNADITILLTDYAKPFYNDLLVPAGNLRDIQVAYKRASYIVVTKSPEQTEPSHIQQTSAYTGFKPGKNLFYSSIQYEAVKNPFSGAGLVPGRDKRILLLTGIANSEPLKNYVNNHYSIIKHLEYRDHYHYTPGDIKKIREIFDNFATPGNAIVTTEKDFIKIERLLDPETRQLPWFVVYISFGMAAHEESFVNSLVKKLELAHG